MSTVTLELAVYNGSLKEETNVPDQVFPFAAAACSVPVSETISITRDVHQTVYQLTKTTAPVSRATLYDRMRILCAAASWWTICVITVEFFLQTFQRPSLPWWKTIPNGHRQLARNSVVSSLNWLSAYSKVWSGESIGGRDGRWGGCVSVKGVDVGQQGAHDGGYTRTKVLGREAVKMCHGLVDGLNAEAHCEFLHQLLRWLVKVNLPAIVPFGGRQFHSAVVDLLRQVMEEVLVQAGVLDVVWGHLWRVVCQMPLNVRCKVNVKWRKLFYYLFFSFNFHADVEPNGARNGRLVRPFLQVVPNVHLARKSSNLKDGRNYWTEHVLCFINRQVLRLTSMMVWPRKSSDSRVNFWRILDLKSLSSSHTRTFIRSDELWHSLQK